MAPGLEQAPKASSFATQKTDRKGAAEGRLDMFSLLKN